MKTQLKNILPVIFLLISISVFESYSQKPCPYQDLTHYSQAFGTEKTYRIYLPEGYEKLEKQYPVIYFFHGWGGRFFKDDSAKLEYKKLGELVDKYQVILVMWDGNIDELEPRPYNIGAHHDVKFDIQMKDYFPEFVEHIDATYHTFADRNHRGIIGFSMGGFMSFYLAGKYPDKVSAAVNLVGSPEFFIGLPENHTLYQMRYTFDNLRDVALLFHNRTNCPMSGLNDEVNSGAIWSEIQNYEYHKLEGDHKVDEPGETKVFESAIRFVSNRFKNPTEPLNRWSHYDLYPEFDIWGYSVKSKKNESGFICLKNVDENGFGFYTQKWLPDGPALNEFKTSITTTPIYKSGYQYKISIFNLIKNETTHFNLLADEKGKLHIELSGENCEVAISEKGNELNFTAFGYQLSQNKKFLKVNQAEELSVKIFNREGIINQAKEIILTISCADSAIKIVSPKQIVSIPETEPVFNSQPFKIFSTKTPPTDGSPAWVRLNVEMKVDSFKFRDVLVLPLFYNVPEFTNIQVDDGVAVASTQNQGDFNKSAHDSIYGNGNADRVVSAGEQIILYENGHRLRLFTDDPFVISEEERLIDEFLPGKWPDGFTLSSVVKISKDCPPNYEIEFLAHYETKTFMPMYRKLQWGKVKIRVASKP